MGAPTRRQNRQQAAERKKLLFEQLQARLRAKKSAAAQPGQPNAPLDSLAPAPDSVAPFAAAEYGKACVSVYDRNAPATILAAQPWTRTLTDLALDAAKQRGVVHLCLVWPGRFETLPLLHVLVNLECMPVGDFQGVRTLLYPAKHTFSYPLNHLLLDRARIHRIYQEFFSGAVWAPARTGNKRLLDALANLQNSHSDTPLPTVAELMPSFIYLPEGGGWNEYHRLLERSLSKIRLKMRRYLGHDVKDAVVQDAANALLAVPAAVTREQWKSALKPHGESVGPDILLLDATEEMSHFNRKAVNRLPEYLHLARTGQPGPPGALIITDEPTRYFVLRAKLQELGIAVTTHVLPLEAERGETALSPRPKPDDWHPALRSLAHCHVEILDRTAAGVAMTLYRIAQELPANSVAREPCEEACYYLLRLASLPAGYQDLDPWLREDERGERLRRFYDWNRYQHDLQLAMGAAGELTERIRKAIVNATELIDAWAENTPMALRLAREVEALPAKPSRRLIAVFPHQNYVELARHFLNRHFVANASSFLALAERVVFKTYNELRDFWPSVKVSDQVLFVGMNGEALRLLLTDECLPHGTRVLLSYRQAESYSEGLARLKSLPELKAYRGRIGLVEQEIKLRLAEIPNPVDLERMPLRAITLDFDVPREPGEQLAQELWKLDLEGRGRAYFAHRIYRYAPDTDPPFERTTVEKIAVGQFVFDLTEDLRAHIETALKSCGAQNLIPEPISAPLLRPYHAEVLRKSAELFPAGSKSQRVLAIHARMRQLDPKVADCTTNRVRYWLSLEPGSESRAPQASRDQRPFQAFCRALEIPDAVAIHYWGAIRTARVEHQFAGRRLAELYFDILFRPEDTQVHQKIPGQVIARLRQEATNCIFRVTRIVSPACVKTKESA